MHVIKPHVQLHPINVMSLQKLSSASLLDLHELYIV